MISIVITSFKEPKTIGKAIRSFVEQDINEDYELYVIAPDEATLDVARKMQKASRKIKTLRDPGKGKSYALNKFLPNLKGRIIILSDGDVYVSNGSVNEIIKYFDNEEIGCVTGRPVSADSRNNMLGYWSHLLCDAGAHKARLRRYKKGKFLECSGYLWAFRNNVVKRFPIDVAEDTVVPYLFREKGYKVGYAPEAKVYVKFPRHLKDFIEQKKRTAKGHESLAKYVNIKKLPRTKSFFNEIFEGHTALFYPRNIKEILWTLFLFPVRLYIWGLVFFHTKVKKDTYKDSWKRVESTK
jgi:cellulose synthase/poly-beta-1,6-N-acetylglucosamine synthase-like glycosyltransferase